MKRALYSRFIVLALLVAIIMLYVTNMPAYFSLNALKTHTVELSNYVRHHYVASVTMFIVVYITTTALFLPTAATLSMLGGFLFGTLLGTLYSTAAGLIGALFAFLIVRSCAGIWLQTRYQSQLSKFNQKFQTHGPYYLMSLRLMSLMPFFVLNILAGLTNVSSFTFIWTTCIGILPGCLVFAYAGEQLQAIQSPHDVLTWPILITFLSLALISLLPLAMKKTRIF